MSAHLQCGCGPSKTPCSCCDGITALTPVPVANRPGLGALAYRVGTHATFLETMLARLSSLFIDVRTDNFDEHNQPIIRRVYPLNNLLTREKDDPSIALLDAWAMVADVLTFYQERIANEGYLRTATERRSVIELAREVGYRLRPGVAASVYLALTVEKNEQIVIEPYEVRAQSVPGPGELPQSFENIEKIDARGRWNKLVPRLTQPQDTKKLTKSAQDGSAGKLYLKGISTGLNQGDPLLVIINKAPLLFRIIEVNADAATNRTQVVVKPWAAPPPPVSTPAALNDLVVAFENPGAARSHLNALSTELEAGRSDANLADFIERETLPGLQRVAARRNISNALRERVRVMSENLGGAITALRESAANTAGTESATSDTEIGEPESAKLALTVNTTTTEAEDTDKEDEDKAQRSVVKGLTKPASVPPPNASRLGRKADVAFAAHSDLGIQALGVFQPSLLALLPVAIGNVSVKQPTPPQVYAFRVKAPLFGHNAPLHSQVTEIDRTTTDPKRSKVDFSEWTVAEVRETEEFLPPDGTPTTDQSELCNVVYLDGGFDKIQAESFVVVDTGAINPDSLRALELVRSPLLIARAAKTATLSRGAYGLSGKATRIELAALSGTGKAPWLRITNNDSKTGEFQVIRRTVVYAQAELLALTEEPIEEDVCPPKPPPPPKPISVSARDGGSTTRPVEAGSDTTELSIQAIVLDGVYSELKSGRWVIVEGERTDVLDGDGNPVAGVKGTELAMLAEVVHDYDSGIAGDTAHTRIKLAANLQYCYARDKLTIYGNVVKATHGETRKETLGSGDGSKPLQQFALKQPPLTYVSAPTPSGVESTLKVFVNDVEWHEAESLFGLQPPDRRFVTTRSDAEVTTAIFGNGKQGARLPTGAENIRAQYRQGIGKAGNVGEGKITLLASRPLSVKEVINPRRASGGADPETRDQARKNAPLAVLALDRLVSTSDYADFARTFGGVGKAYSVRLSDGIRELVHVTIAGAGDAPIEEDSELLRNLRLALNQFGDPALPVSVAVRELLLLVISARVRLLPDYVWEKVAPKIRAKLLEKLSFEARELGQDVFLSEVISSMQSVPGVNYIDVDALGGIAERNADGNVRTPNELIAAAQSIVNAGTPAQRVRVNLPELPRIGTDRIRPAQLAYLAPEVPDTLILNLIE